VTPAAWEEANRVALADEVAEVREVLRRWLDEGGEPGQPGTRSSASPGLERVVQAFGLSPFERSFLLLCAGSELDGELARLCGRANGDPRQTGPTFGLGLACLPGAHWSAITPAAPLRRWNLVLLTGQGALTSTPCRIDERVLHALVGLHYLPPGLAGRLRQAPESTELPTRWNSVVQHVADNLVGDGGRALVQVQADPRRGGSAIAAQAVPAPARRGGSAASPTSRWAPPAKTTLSAPT
jgi:hypothetical protein